MGGGGRQENRKLEKKGWPKISTNSQPKIMEMNFKKRRREVKD